MSKSIENTYKKKTQLEHILLRPDTYIGSVDAQQQLMWVVDDSDEQRPRMVHRQISYVPGLYKIFDEIIVNAADNIQRDPRGMTQIKVNIDRTKGTIKVWNNGLGIPVVVHQKEKVYVPELIFGHLLTSSNYDDAQKKVTGGRNGFGAKLANIFSKKFEVECADTKRRKLFKQTFKNNMSQVLESRTTEYPAESYDYTSITFEPDLKKFGMKSIDDDIYNLFKKRVYDLAGCSPKSISVYLNGKKLSKIKNFADYVDLYFPTADRESPQPRAKYYEKVNSRWEVCVGPSDSGSFQQVSFVNNICTTRGGAHCNYIADQIVKKCTAVLAHKHKKLEVKPAQIRNNLFVFINCLIENPAFDSQTKETLTLKKEKFGSECELSDSYLKKVLDCGIIQNIVDFAHAKQSIEMKRKLGQQGKKQQRLLGIPKLEDANSAGTQHSRLCTLILTEGDSAKTLAMSGIQIVGRDHYGVFPLKGKLLNVRDAPSKALLQNVEIQNLMKIIGLQLERDYSRPENFATLRYGCVMIMTDQDHDGSHIKGLIINFFEHFWPSLLKKAGFLKEFVTPIIKITKRGSGQTPKTFFTIPEYKDWEAQATSSSRTSSLDGFTIKYYKGLGTSTAQEAKEYFSDLKKHIIQFKQKDEKCIQDIHLAFSKALADQRKAWIGGYDRDAYVDHNVKQLTYQDFINKELIHFSLADNMRSIPSVMDGLKPGQRKIIYACFKRKLRSEIKVAQLSGYVAEHSAYHHGEMSLQQTIVNMAQDFVGSNNLNLLLPIGQFGTRLMGGKESASARYIFTNLNPLCRILFPEEDDALLQQTEDEGMKIEPAFYQPTIPMVLVNGAEGIGTGWSTSIPCFNPRDIIDNIKARLRDSAFKFKRMHPWYKNFTGTIEPTPDYPGSYTVSGKWSQLDKKSIEITELPIKKWTRDYKTMLEEMMMKNDLIEDIREFHTDNTVRFVLGLVDDVKKVENEVQGGILKKLRLQTNMSANNYVLFNLNGQIKKYSDECEILEEFFGERLKLYHERKAHLLRLLKKDCQMLQNKARFIQEITEGRIVLRDKSKPQLLQMLIRDKYLTSGQLDEIARRGDHTPINIDEVMNSPEESLNSRYNFDYLLGMPLWSLTKEKIQQLENQLKQKEAELRALEGKAVRQLWEDDLDRLLDDYDFGVAKEAKTTKGTTTASKFNSCSDTQQKSSLHFSNSDGKSATAKSQQLKANTTATVKKASGTPKAKASSTKDKRTSKQAAKTKGAPSASSSCSFRDDFGDSESEEVIVKHRTARRPRQVLEDDSESHESTARKRQKRQASPESSEEAGDEDMESDHREDKGKQQAASRASQAEPVLAQTSQNMLTKKSVSPSPKKAKTSESQQAITGVASAPAKPAERSSPVPAAKQPNVAAEPKAEPDRPLSPSPKPAPPNQRPKESPHHSTDEDAVEVRRQRPAGRRVIVDDSE